MYYQHQDKKAWLGTVIVFAIRGRDIFIFANGSVRKVSRCNIKLCEAKNTEEEKVEEKEKLRKRVALNRSKLTEEEKLEEKEKLQERQT